MMPRVDPNMCPFCQRANGCMAHSSEPCWCSDTRVPQTLIDRVPPLLQRKACICADCITAFTRDPEQFARNHPCDISH